MPFSSNNSRSKADLSTRFTLSPILLVVSILQLLAWVSGQSEAIQIDGLGNAQRAHHTSTLIDHSILILGGEAVEGPFGDYVGSLFALSSGSEDKKGSLHMDSVASTPIPYPEYLRTRHTLTPLHEGAKEFLVCGGIHPRTQTSETCQILSYPSGQVRQLPSLPWSRRLDHTMTLGHGDQIYIVGGRDGGISDASIADRGNVLRIGMILVSDQKGGVIVKPMAPAPTGWYEHTASWVPSTEKLFFLGGVREDGTVQTLDKVHVYDPKSNTWKKEDTKWPEDAPSPNGRYGHTATVIGDSIIVVGGASEPSRALGNLETPQMVDITTILVLNATTLVWSLQVLDLKTSNTSEWIPSPRLGHTTSLLWDQRTLLITWGKDMIRQGAGDTHPYLLDTKLWSFVKDVPMEKDMVFMTQVATSHSWRVYFLIGSSIAFALFITAMAIFYIRFRRQQDPLKNMVGTV
ncbi:MAG: hypothetical protein DHS80DRAFT_29514 [Piptocephalis tieghemiana]|nr:MAG: hypothetical protein DHS80DRAFT_29514 [Piptocephalis tieghemiana]